MALALVWKMGVEQSSVAAPTNKRTCTGTFSVPTKFHSYTVIHKPLCVSFTFTSFIIHPTLLLRVNVFQNDVITVINEGNALPADRVDFFSIFAAFKRTFAADWFIDVFVMLLGLGYVYFWVIIGVTCGLVIQFTHVYGIVSICACFTAWE